MKNKKKAGIIAGSILAGAIAAGGIATGFILSNQKITITFNSDGGSSFGEIEIKKGTSGELPVPLKVGYKFVGWYLDSAKTIKVTDTSTIKNSTKLYALWSLNSYNISFVDPLNIVKEISAIESDYNSTIDLTSVNSIMLDNLNNYEFAGWSESFNGELMDNQDQVKVKLYGQTLYANWVGSSVDVNFSNSTTSVKLNTTIVLPEPTVSSNEVFFNYKVKNKTYYPGQKVLLTADMIENKSITFGYEKADSSGVVAKVIYVEADGTEIDMTKSIQNKSAMLTPPDNAGYKFGGWYKTSEFKQEDEVLSLPETTNRNIALFAKRVGEDRKVTFNYGDAKLIDDSITQKLEFDTKVGESLILLDASNYIKANLDFAGWQFGSKPLGNGGNVFVVPTDATIEITATWGSAFNLLMFNMNGGQSQEGEFNEVYNIEGNYDLPTAKPTKLGYDFAGWSGNANGSGSLLQPGESFHVSSGYKTILYAVWKPVNFEIVYNYNIGATDPRVEHAVFGSTITVIPAAQQKPGYQFAGWSIMFENGTKHKFAAGASLLLNQELKLTNNQVVFNAIWEVKKFKYTITTTLANQVSLNGAGITITHENGEGLIDTYQYGQMIPFGSTIVIKKSELRDSSGKPLSKLNYDLIGIVGSDNVVKNPIDGALGDINKRINFDDNDIISFVLDVDYSNNSKVEQVLNYKPNEIKIEYNGGDFGTVSTSAETQTTYYDAEKEFSPQALQNVITPNKGYHFSHWEVGSYQFFGNGIKQHDLESKIYADKNALIGNDGKITLVAKYIANINGTIKFVTGNSLALPVPEPLTEDITTIEGKTREVVVTLADKAIVEPKLIGRTLVGWSETKGGTTPVKTVTFTNSDNVNQEKTLYAIWKDNIYDIVYYRNTTTTDNSIVGVEKTIQFNYQTDISLSASDEPKFEGHNFLGWSLSRTGGAIGGNLFILNEGNFDEILGSENKIKFYAVWQLQNMKGLTFNANDQNGTTSIDKDSLPTVTPVDATQEDAKITIPEKVPTRFGYTFVKWNTNADGSGDDYSVNEDFNILESHGATTNLYAIWQAKEFTLKYNKGEGELVDGSGSIDDKLVLFNKDYIVTSATLTRDGYSFMGWAFKENSDITDKVTSHKLINKTYIDDSNNVNFYPIWVIQDWKTITFDFGTEAEGVKGSIDPIRVEVSLEDKTISLPSKVEIDAKVSKTGHTFLAFRLSPNGNNISEVTIPKNGSSITIYAKWEPVTYQVDFNLNYTGAGVSSLPNIFGTTKTISDILAAYPNLKEPTRDEYEFLGWSASKTATEATYVNSSNFTHSSASNVVLYGVWKALFYNISFNINGATGTAPATIKSTVVDNVSTPVEIWQNNAGFSKTAQNFVCWELRQGESTRRIYAGDIITAAELTSNITLNAIYGIQSLMSDTSVFDSNGKYIGGDRSELHLPSNIDFNIAQINANIGLVTFATGITSIPSGAIESATLSRIVIPNSVASIGVGAFRTNALTEFALEANVTTLFGNPIYGTKNGRSSLAKFTLAPSHTSLKVVDDKILLSIDEQTLFAVTSDVTDKMISDIFALSKIKFIRDAAFNYNHTLTSLNISNNVTSIGANVFMQMPNLTTINLSNGISSSIESSFGSGLVKLTTITGGNNTFAFAMDNILYSSNAKTSLIKYINPSATKFAASANLSRVSEFAFENANISDLDLTNGIAWFDAYDSLKTTATKVGLGANLTLGANTLKDFNKVTELTVSKQSLLPNLSTKMLTLSTLNLDYTNVGEGAVVGTSIEKSFINGVSSLRTLKITSNVRTIGNYALEYTENITTVIIEDGTTDMGISAFNTLPNLESITLPNTLKSIGNYGLQANMKLKSIVIPNSVTSIGNYAFATCTELTSVTLSNALTTISNSLFNGCAKLASIDIPNSVTSIGDTAFNGCTGLTNVTIGNKVSHIGQSAFSHCSFSQISLPDSLTSIADSAFVACVNLTSIVIPNSVTYLSTSVFYDCTKLSSVTIGSGITDINAFTFYGCTSLTSFVIPSTVTNGVAANAFQNCTNIKVLTVGRQNQLIGIGSSLPNLTTLIFNYANVGEGGTETSGVERTFFGNRANLKTVNMTSAVTTISSCAFKGTGLTRITIPSSVTSIGYSLFEKCSNLEQVDILGTIRNIADYMFKDCTSLTNITIPNSVTNVGKEAFTNCTSLTSITIPNSVTSIGDSAFKNCTSLTSVKMNSTTPPTIGSNLFNGMTNFKINVSAGSYDLYKNASGWSAYVNNLWVSGTITDDSNYYDLEYEFTGNGEVSVSGYLGAGFVLEIPETITTGSSVFTVTGLTNNSFLTNNAFYSITIGNYVDISAEELLTVVNASILKKFSLGDRVHGRIEDSAFGYLNELEYLRLGGIENIGNSAFEVCTKLKYISIPDSVERIEDYAFGETAATTISIGAGVKYIGSQAFLTGSFESALKAVNIQAVTPPELGSDVFSGHSDFKIFVPVGSLNAYQTANGWKYYSDKIYEQPIVIPENNQNGSLIIENDVAYLTKDFTTCKIGFMLSIPSNGEVILPDIVGGRDTDNYQILYITQLGGNIGTDGSTMPIFLLSSIAAEVKSITIPSTVMKIDEIAFQGCVNLKTININATMPPTLPEGAFDGMLDFTIYVPAGSLDFYQYAPGWIQYLDRIVEMPNA